MTFSSIRSRKTCFNSPIESARPISHALTPEKILASKIPSLFIVSLLSLFPLLLLTQSLNCLWISSCKSVITFTSSGFCGWKGSNIPLFSPFENTLLSTPIFLITSTKPKPAEITPIEPTIDAGITNISSAEQASQYPPEAATSSTNANTGILFLPDNSTILSEIKAD